MQETSPEQSSSMESRRAERVERRRQRILDAAGECFAARGFAKTTIEEVAAKAGVSKGLVYRHFDGKESLLDAVLDRTITDWAQETDTLVDPRAGVLEQIAASHRAALAYARGNPVLRALLKQDPLVLAWTGGTAVERAMEQFRVSTLERLHEGVARGELRDDLDLERLVDVVRLFHIAFIDLLLNPRWIDGSDETLAEVGIEVLLHGIARGERPKEGEGA